MVVVVRGNWLTLCGNVVFLQLTRFRGLVLMKRNETWYALKFLWPSGLLGWVNCRLWNVWVHIKCANLSKMEARSLANFKCSRCSSVNTIPQCYDDSFRQDTNFNSVVVHLKRVPKSSRIPVAENLIPNINDICETPSNIGLLCLLIFSLSCFLEKSPQGGRSHHSVH